MMDAYRTECFAYTLDTFEYWQENEHGHDLRKEGYAIRRKCVKEWKICINYGWNEKEEE